DASGAPFALYSYDAYGNPGAVLTDATARIPAALAQAIAEANVLRYAGCAYDAHSGLYYLSKRYYDPATAQFLTKDPAKADGEESPYQYCGGDPVGKVDPSGELASDYYSKEYFDYYRPGHVGRMILICATQVGEKERRDGSTKYGEWWAKRVGDRSFRKAPWCDMFISWCAYQSGCAGSVGLFAKSAWHARWFKSKHQWGHEPKRGAIAFFNFHGNKSVGSVEHVGIVTDVLPHGRIKTIEGNTRSGDAGSQRDGDGVYRRVRSRSVIVGFGYPAYL
ncbi:MAG: CHAP domain-containing protein, partial [Coriobacteriia bacterium]|nr:CHAP domain-containing protein [Coriobacteriia bacterium]